MKHELQVSRLLRTYVSGFILSVALTLGAYLLVQAHVGSGKQLLAQPLILAVILVFALVQLLVQLFFFLHLNDENRPRWRLLMLLFAASTVIIIAVGSIWIMANLNYHMSHSPEAVNHYLESQGNL